MKLTENEVENLWMQQPAHYVGWPRMFARAVEAAVVVKYEARIAELEKDTDYLTKKVQEAGSYKHELRKVCAELKQADKRIAEIESQRDYEKEKAAECLARNVGLSLQLAAEQAHRVECVRMLQVLGNHDVDCTFFDLDENDERCPCDCGLEAALKATPTEALRGSGGQLRMRRRAFGEYLLLEGMITAHILLAGKRAFTALIRVLNGTDGRGYTCFRCYPARAT